MLRLDELALLVAGFGALVLGLKEVATKLRTRAPHREAAHPETGADLNPLPGHK